MSHDMLGPLMRELVGFKKKKLGLVFDVVQRLTSVEGEEFFRDLKKFVRSWKGPANYPETLKAFLESATGIIFVGQLKTDSIRYCLARKDADDGLSVQFVNIEGDGQFYLSTWDAVSRMTTREVSRVLIPTAEAAVAKIRELGREETQAEIVAGMYLD